MIEDDNVPDFNEDADVDGDEFGTEVADDFDDGGDDAGEDDEGLDDAVDEELDAEDWRYEDDGEYDEAGNFITNLDAYIETYEDDEDAGL